MEKPERFAYFDHNVLDLMTKGDPHKVKDMIQVEGLTPIYSNETLKEIHRSLGYEEKFLNLLEEINAKFIEPVLDGKFKQTGDARIFNISPNAAYEQFLRNKSESPDGDFGLSEMLMKFYGGKQDSSFTEIFEKGANELQAYLSQVFENSADDPCFKSEYFEQLKVNLSVLPDVMKTLTSKMAANLDESQASTVSEFEKKTGIGPKQLKNIQPPDVVLKIWKFISERIDAKDIDLEIFFGIKPHYSELDAGRERTLQEKVNAIYHQLNFLGYYRDSNIKKENRFTASFSDMTHAGIASFCHVFLCRDEDLVKKAAAAFDYLGVETEIWYFQANNSN